MSATEINHQNNNNNINKNEKVKTKTKNKTPPLSPNTILLKALQLEQIIQNTPESNLDLKLSQLRNLKSYLQPHISESFSINLHLCYLRNFPSLDTFTYSLSKLMQHYCMNEIIALFINYLNNKVNNQQEKVEAMRFISKSLFYPFFNMNQVYSEYCEFEEMLSKVTADTLIKEIENEFTNVIKMRNKLILNTNIINTCRAVRNIENITISEFDNKIMKNVRFHVFLQNLELEKQNLLKLCEIDLCTRVYKLFLFELDNFWNLPEFYYLWESFDIKEGDIMLFNSKFVNFKPIETYHYYFKQYLTPELFEYPLYSETLLYLHKDIKIMQKILKKLHKSRTTNKNKNFCKKLSLLQINYLTRILIETSLKKFKKEFKKIVNIINNNDINSIYSNYVIFFIAYSLFLQNRQIDEVLEIYNSVSYINTNDTNNNLAFILMFDFLSFVDLEASIVFEKVFSRIINKNNKESSPFPIRIITDAYYNINHTKGDQRFNFYFSKLSNKLSFGELSIRENNLNTFLDLFYSKFTDQQIKEMKPVFTLTKNLSVLDLLKWLKMC
ncbi:hypothetical protein CDIK_3161 [Cucumispora dikerogammari]|nr:hypothetical protein CDIK_3161 [Cucumispora dikerogammari]